MSKLLRIIFSAVLLAVLAFRMNWAKIVETFATLRLEWWLLAAVLLVLTQFVSTRRWQLMAQPLGFHDSYKRLAGFYFIGMYFNLLLPTSVGGDVIRAWYLDAGSKRRVKAFASVFLDRVSGVLVLVALACVAVVVSPLALPGWLPWLVAGMSGGVVATLGAIAVADKLPLGEKTAQRLKRFQTALTTLRSPGLVVHTALLSLFVQAANVVIVWLVGLALGLDVPASYWVLVPMVSLLCMLPMSLNGMGVREGAMTLFLAPLGVSEESAVALALLWFAVATAVSLLGGLVYLFGRFPRVEADKLSQEGPNDHGSLDRHSDQGRARQPGAAA